MNISETFTLLTRVGLECELKDTGDTRYKRGFVKRGNISLGRITFFEGEYEHIKWYWKGTRDLIDPLDYWPYAWQVMVNKRVLLFPWQWDIIVCMAIKRSTDDYEAKRQWRRENPLPERDDGKRRSRRKLEGRSPRAFVPELIEEFLHAVDLHPSHRS